MSIGCAADGETAEFVGTRGVDVLAIANLHWPGQIRAREMAETRRALLCVARGAGLHLSISFFVRPDRPDRMWFLFGVIYMIG